jgi:L-ascorbate metabolism protein UlaG (beta-lactamase superfamily)
MGTRHLALPLIMLLCTVSLSWSLAQQKDTCTAIYVANEGFLIKTKEHKVLIDALFGNIKGNWCDQPGDTLVRKMLHGVTPFDNIDVVLVTHKHSDHFNESMVMDFLRNNPQAMLVCPDQVREVLRRNADYPSVSGRIVSPESRAQKDTSVHNGQIHVTALKFPHGSYFETDSVSGKPRDIHRDVENLAFVIDLDGFAILHTGDGSPSSGAQFFDAGLARKDFDLVFVDRTFLRREGLDVINKYIETKNLVFMHVEPGRGEYYRSIIKTIPEMFVFTSSLEKKSVVR